MPTDTIYIYIYIYIYLGGLYKYDKIVGRGIQVRLTAGPKFPAPLNGPFPTGGGGTNWWYMRQVMDKQQQFPPAIYP